MTIRKRLLIVVCFFWLTTPAQAGWWFTITPPAGAGPVLYIGPFPAPSKTWSICADWCGSAWWRHGPNCLDDPTAYNCQPWPPGHPDLGFGQRDGGTVSTCFELTPEQVQAMHLRKLKWGFYYIAYKAGWALEREKGAAFTLNDCKALTAWPYERDRCCGVGAISNTEGSPDGP
jgi:hypothetical protein